VIQNLVRKAEVSDLIADYGHLIVDECHHLSAASFELVARRSNARYVLGLSMGSRPSRRVIHRSVEIPLALHYCGAPENPFPIV